MQVRVLPIFSSHYSIGKAILTLAESEVPKKPLDTSCPVSIFDIAKTHGLKEVVLVDESISGFLEAYTNAKKAGVKLVFGLRLRCIESIAIKSEHSLKTLHKVIVFAKNADGYKDLIKISSLATQAGFYYKPNIDMSALKRMWSRNLAMAVPFYDSFLFNNALYGHVCVPNFFEQPTFFVEDSNLPFDGYIHKKVRSYANDIKAEIVHARSIYYYKKGDFTAYLTFRCISERGLLEKPELEHCGSHAFSFEEWEEQNGRASA